MVIVVALLAASGPAWTVSMPYLDDNGLTSARLQDGFWGPTAEIFDQFAWYRVVNTAGLSLVYAFADQLWVIRGLGIVAHSAIVVLVALTLRRCGAGSRAAAAVVVVLGLYPYHLEATTWAAAFLAYPVCTAVVAGSALMLARRRLERRWVIAAAFVSTSMLLLQEQLIPLVGLVLLVHVVAVRRALVPVLLGAAAPAVFFLTSIAASLDTNPRFSGADGASAANLLDNLPFFREYARLLPLGDLFLDTRGFGTAFTVLGALMAVLAVLVALRLAPHRDAAEAGSPVTRDAPTGGLALRGWTASRWALPAVAAGGGALAAAAAITPLLTSGNPYLTARVLYLPVLGIAVAVAGLFELVERTFDRPAVAPVLGVLLLGAGAWSGVALAAEAAAYGKQLRHNDRVLTDLVDLADPAQVFRDGRVLVVAGFPGTVVDRPQFGEHILSIAPANVTLAAVREGVDRKEFEKQMDFRAGWEGVCVLDKRWISTYAEYREARPTQWKNVRNPTREAVFALWVDEAWRLQTPEQLTPYGAVLHGRIPDCVHAERPPDAG